MFESYKDIFNHRGDLYHQAMAASPRARLEEFKTLIDLLEIRKGDVLADIPSGGGYLQNYLDLNNAETDLTLYSVDSSAQFLRNCPGRDKVVCGDVAKLPFRSESFHKVFSLAGVHHMSDKKAFFKEVSRMLRFGGIFGLADVESGSRVDRFLNVFVDQFNSMGHKGIFLDESTRLELESCNFEIVVARNAPVTWRFLDKLEMINFVTQLFGLDKANDQDVEKGINEFLRVQRINGAYCLNWELLYIKARKQRTADQKRAA